MFIGDRTAFILVCLFAIFWQWKQPPLPLSIYSQLAWNQRQSPNAPSQVSFPTSPTMEQPLLGVTVVITGATSGLGLGLAKVLHQMGATILAVGRSSAKLSSVKNLLSDPSSNTQRVYTFIADFTDLVSVSKAADEIKTQFKSIDFLINNAGMYHAATLERATVQGYDIVFGGK
jgi:NADPH:quinone reductase-like Zn-dependent oxidoreductase